MTAPIMPIAISPYPYPADRRESSTCAGVFGAEQLNTAFEGIYITGTMTATELAEWLEEHGMDFSWTAALRMPKGSDRRIDRILSQLKRDGLIHFDKATRTWRPVAGLTAPPEPSPTDNPVSTSLGTGDGNG